MQPITVQTHANISLIKYWGKRDEHLFLPTKSSICTALSELTTTTTIARSESNSDEITINWQTAPEQSQTKIVNFINLFRKTYDIKEYFSINTHNNFPTAAGLASSSSGFAALALALNAFCKLNLTNNQLSILARQGSGSACRSIFGGFVVWHKGNKPDGSDSYAAQIFRPEYWPEFRILVVVIRNDAKKVSSREGMRITTDTSPSYQSWLTKSAQRIPLMIDALKNKNIEAVGELTEADWADMQQTMLDSSPQLDYWTPASHAVMKSVQTLRSSGYPCYFTTEAGPNVKVICLEKDVDSIKNTIQSIDGVLDIITCKVAENPIITTESTFETLKYPSMEQRI